MRPPADEVEYDCEGCGVHVFAVGIPEPPAHGFCATCGWLSEFVPPEEIMPALRRCELIRYAALQEFARLRRELLRLLPGGDVIPSAKTTYRT